MQQDSFVLYPLMIIKFYRQFLKFFLNTFALFSYEKNYCILIEEIPIEENLGVTDKHKIDPLFGDDFKLFSIFTTSHVHFFFI